MENDYSSFMQKNDDGSVASFDNEKFTSFIDASIGKAVEAYKAKAQKEQEKANMNENERIAKEREEFEAEKLAWSNSMKSQKRDLVIEKAKAKLSNGFSETEIALFTQNVTDDEKTSLKYIEDLVAERNKFLEDSKKKLIEELQNKQPVSSSQSNADSGKNQTKSSTISSDDIKNIYK